MEKLYTINNCVLIGSSVVKANFTFDVQLAITFPISSEF